MTGWVKPSFVIFLTSGHSDAQSWASECPCVKNYKRRLNPVWHGCFMAVPIWQQSASVKGLNYSTDRRYCDECLAHPRPVHTLSTIESVGSCAVESRVKSSWIDVMSSIVIVCNLSRVGEHLLRETTSVSWWLSKDEVVELIAQRLNDFWCRV